MMRGCSWVCMGCVGLQQLGAHGMRCGARGCFANAGPWHGWHRRQTTSNAGRSSRAEDCLAASLRSEGEVRALDAAADRVPKAMVQNVFQTQ